MTEPSDRAVGNGAATMSARVSTSRPVVPPSRGNGRGNAAGASESKPLICGPGSGCENQNDIGSGVAVVAN